jgi:hypothetical protein
LNEEVEVDPLEKLAGAFRDQLLACLEECARGRAGLFSDNEGGGADAESWPEAARLRQLAVALQSVFAQHEQANTLCDEFLDLCSIHGESNPGERKLARAFLERIEKGDVGKQLEEGERRW